MKKLNGAAVTYCKVRDVRLRWPCWSGRSDVEDDIRYHTSVDHYHKRASSQADMEAHSGTGYHLYSSRDTADQSHHTRLRGTDCNLQNTQPDSP